MSGDFLGAVLRRIDRRQKALRSITGERVSDRSVSLAAGLSADYLRSLRRQYERGTQVGITTPALHAIAAALKTTNEWLEHGIGPEAAGLSEDCVEVKFSWVIVPNNHDFFVEEQFGAQPIKRWGPVPTRESARALIDSRIAPLQELLRTRK